MNWNPHDSIIEELFLCTRPEGSRIIGSRPVGQELKIRPGAHLWVELDEFVRRNSTYAPHSTFSEDEKEKWVTEGEFPMGNARVGAVGIPFHLHVRDVRESCTGFEKCRNNVRLCLGAFTKSYFVGETDLSHVTTRILNAMRNVIKKFNILLTQ